MDRNQYWKNKVQEIFNTCQEELKRTTEIGRKMLSASKTNSSLHEAYEQLGLLVANAIEKGELQWKDQRVKELLEKIKECQSDLEVIEGEVNKIKFASAPHDVSTTREDEESHKKP